MVYTLYTDGSIYSGFAGHMFDILRYYGGLSQRSPSSTDVNTSTSGNTSKIVLENTGEGGGEGLRAGF